MFRDKLPVIEPMNQMMQGLKDEELRKMAASLTKVPPPKPSGGPIDMGRMERARAIIEQHRCNFCHQGNYKGEQNVPRLAGQREDYLTKAMRDYKNNTRRGYDLDGGRALSNQRRTDFGSCLFCITSSLE